MTKIKICGIRSLQDIDFVNEALPDYIGFVFAPGKRQVDVSTASLLKSNLNEKIKAVGVFVNADIDFIKNLCDRNVIDVVQLHGDENDEFIESLRKMIDNPIIKAVRVSGKIQSVCNNVDYPLFDSDISGQYGGTGKKFNWDMVKGIKTPFFLAGGINAGNVLEGIRSTHPYCVDVSSGVETDEIKVRDKILKIVNLVRSVK